MMFTKGVLLITEKKTVNKANFEAVLLGEESKVIGGNGKVLKSTGDDKVFINFVDHGGTGMIMFPHNQHMLADELMTIL